MNAEHERLEEARTNEVPWRKWGPYLSERQWGTVREDYSNDGNAWDYFTHDQARSRAYHPKKSGLAAVSYAILNPTGAGPTFGVRGKARMTASNIRRHRSIGFNCSVIERI